ncbi:MAG: O-antigen ligase family protein [Bacteroidota bacterium]
MNAGLLYRFQNTFLNEQWKSILIYLYVFFLPVCDWLPVKINSFLIIIISLIWLTEQVRVFRGWRIIFSFEFFLLSAIFLLQLLSFFHGGSSQDIEHNLLVKLPFFIFPLVWGHFHKNISFHSIMKYFVLGTLLACICSFRFLCSSSYSISDILDYTTYESYLVLHRPYFGIYLVLSIVLLMYNIRSLWSYLLLIFFLLFLFLIQSKMSWFAFILILLIHFAFHPKRKIRTILSTLTIILCLASVFSAAIYYAQKQDKLGQSSGFERFFILSVNTRLVHFDCAWDILKSDPLFGAGAGHSVRLMKHCYDIYPSYRPAFNQSGKYFNAHNEFLEEGIRHGVLGLMIYAVCFFFFFRQSVRHRNKIYLQFLVIVIVASATESLFSRAQGVLLIAFFNTLFYINPSIGSKADTHK